VCLLAQTTPVTFPDAVRAATERYAAVRVSQEQVTAAALGIELVRTQYLPKADLLGQLNRGTRNNIFGMVLPQSTLPSISGPPLAENSMTSVWGSMTGFTVSWEPFDFGQRRLQLEAAGAAKRHAEASVARTRFEVAAAAADTYLTALAAGQMLRVADAQRRRAQVTMDIVSAQVKAELRPGLDVTRMQAEVTLAENQRIQAEQAIAIAKAALSRFLNEPPAGITLIEGKFLGDPPAALFTSDRQASRHPAAREQAAAIESQRAKESALDKSYYPRFNLQGSTYARGSGARPDFTTGGAFSGFGPNIVNWGAGLTVTFPALALPGLRAQRSIEAATARIGASSRGPGAGALQGRALHHRRSSRCATPTRADRD
jgi:outer membrane protein TolC